jgi:hypothetical protein
MKEIKLTKGKIAIVNDEDFDRINKFKWCALKNATTWYAIRTVYTKNPHSKQTIYMHKEILSKEGFTTDHINGDGLNNTRGNLRIATVTENNRNKRKNRNSISKYKGVSLNKHIKDDKVYQYWRATIMANGVKISLGSFDNELDAATMYDKAAKLYHGEFSNTNCL